MYKVSTTFLKRISKALTEREKDLKLLLYKKEHCREKSLPTIYEVKKRLKRTENLNQQVKSFYKHG